MKVLVTGGAEGLGAAIVQRSLIRGDQVCVLDRQSPPETLGPAFFEADLEQIDTLAERVGELAPHGPFDLVVMSAGISAVGKFETVLIETSLSVLKVNALAPIVLTQLMLRHGLIARNARVVYVSSLSHFVGYPGASAYAASKDAIVAFARSIRRTLIKENGVRVQVAAPGPMRTAHAQRYAPPGSSDKNRMHPDKVARAILDARRGFWIIPGYGPYLMALLGRSFPGFAIRAMRRLIFERLP